jgi:2-dehydropantoate 2-reductase
MRIAIMGSGGVGGYVGGRLAASGQDVTFIARGAHLAALQEQGLRIESARGDVTVQPAQATDDPAAVGPVDLVIFAVKLYDTEQAAAATRPRIGPHRGGDRRAGRDPPHRDHGPLPVRRARRGAVGARRGAVGGAR